jgi:hypothetical protein
VLRWSLSIFAVVGSLGCAAPSAEPSRVPGAGVADDESKHEPSEHASSASTASGGDSDHANHDDSDRSRRGVARISSEPAAPGDAVDLGDFCTQHQIAANLDVERCVSTPLGTRPDAQLWCSRREELDDNRVAYYVALYRVQGKRLAKVTELVYAAGPKPLEERPQDITYYVKLFPDVAADAKSFQMHEESGFSCDEALKRVRDEYSLNPDLEKSIEQLVLRVCATRGTYTASGKRQK